MTVHLPDGRHGQVRHDQNGYWHVELDADSPRRSFETWVVVRADLAAQLPLIPPDARPPFARSSDCLSKDKSRKRKVGEL